MLGRRASALANGDGEDLAQEAIARALASGVPVEALPWLRTVVRRLAIDRVRRSREIPFGDASDLDGLGPAASAGPDEALETAETREAVRRALTTLPPRYREALLAYAEHDTAAAVAGRFGLSAEATWSLLSRARARLRAELRRTGFAPAAMFVRLAAALAPVAVGVAIVAIGHHPSHGPAAPSTRDGIVRAADSLSPANVARTAVVPSRPSLTAGFAPPSGDFGGADASTRYGGRACAPPETGSVAVFAEVRFEDNEGASVSEHLFAQLPSQARDVFVEEC